MKARKYLSTTFLSVLLSMMFIAGGQLVTADSTAAKIDDHSSITNQKTAESFNNLNHIMFIEGACAHYHSAYGKFPASLNDLLDGFMLIWPGSIFTGKPVGIIDRMPYPGNQKDIGKVFYERVNDHQAYLYFLDFDIKSAVDGDYVWIVDKHEIELQAWKDNHDGTKGDAPFLIQMGAEGRLDYGYQVGVDQAFTQLLTNTLGREGNFNKDFGTVLRDRKFFSLDSGLAQLRQQISENKIQFDIGTMGDNLNYYYTMQNYNLRKGELERLTKCVEVKGSSDGQFVLDTMKDCNSNSASAQSYINSKNFNSLTIPADVIITKADVM